MTIKIKADDANTLKTMAPPLRSALIEYSAGVQLSVPEMDALIIRKLVQADGSCLTKSGQRISEFLVQEGASK